MCLLLFLLSHSGSRWLLRVGFPRGLENQRFLGRVLSPLLPLGGAVHALLQIQLRSRVRRHDPDLPLRSSRVFLPLRIDRFDPLRCAGLLLRVDPIREEDAEEEVRVLRHSGEGGRE